MAMHSFSRAVFIHRSIKTRIETPDPQRFTDTARLFLYIDPLKQGLKLAISMSSRRIRAVFIHRSIKTRIETESFRPFLASESGFYT